MYLAHLTSTLRSLLTFLLFWGIGNAKAQDKALNAVIPGDYADPSVINVKDTYYSVGTSSEWAPHFPIYQSKDLINWKQTGYVFAKAPAWTSGSFWAPEYVAHQGKYYIYYTARRKSDNISCIGVASSKYPDRGFVDHGVIIEEGNEAIDAFVFEDKGQRYITYKAYGLSDRPIEILGRKLASNGLKTEGKPFSLLVDQSRMGLEGQSFVKHDDYYYLFYSAGGCCGKDCSYNVSVARSKNFKGPYEKYEGNPLLSENSDWKCSGHGTFVSTAKGNTYYLYHAYNKENTVFGGRQGMLASLAWSKETGWPILKERSGNKGNNNLVFDFKNKTVDRAWQWDFHHAKPIMSQSKGEFRLSGSTIGTNLTGIVATVRPLAAVFEAAAEVLNTNEALKGLAYYGDANAAIGVGVQGNELQFWMVKGKERKVISSAQLKEQSKVELKIKVDHDLRVQAFYRRQSGDWIQLDGDANADFLPPWDRSPRIGLHFLGKPQEFATFNKFVLKYD